MKGYWQREDATEEVMRGGWFHSGDMATQDDDGYFFIVDRKKDMIIRGGYNVYPREIEEVLYEHPAVSEVAVIGVPDDSLGEEVAAMVVLKSGEDASADDIRALRQGARRGLQVPAQDLVLRGAPEGPDGQDPQARDQGAVGGRELGGAAGRAVRRAHPALGFAGGARRDRRAAAAFAVARALADGVRAVRALAAAHPPPRRAPARGSARARRARARTR